MRLGIIVAPAGAQRGVHPRRIAEIERHAPIQPGGRQHASVLFGQPEIVDVGPGIEDVAGRIDCLRPHGRGKQARLHLDPVSGNDGQVSVEVGFDQVKRISAGRSLIAQAQEVGELGIHAVHALDLEPQIGRCGAGVRGPLHTQGELVENDLIGLVSEQAPEVDAVVGAGRIHRRAGLDTPGKDDSVDPRGRRRLIFGWRRGIGGESAMRQGHRQANHGH